MLNEKAIIRNSIETRNSSLECFRIICMILIVMHHYSVHGFIRSELYYSVNKYMDLC